MPGSEWRDVATRVGGDLTNVKQHFGLRKHNSVAWTILRSDLSVIRFLLLVRHLDSYIVCDLS